MRCQQQPGGSANKNLVRRTKVNWCLPSLVNCESIISEAISIYDKGDEKIPPHRVNTFFIDTAKKYEISKVIDCFESEEGRCPFFSNYHDYFVWFNFSFLIFCCKTLVLFIAIFAIFL